jgi:glycosyltransferase involved in cell wall biosynthesis
MRVCMVGYTNFINDARLHRYSQSLLEQGHQVDMVGVGESVGNEPVIQYGVRVFQIHSRDFAESGPVSYLKNMLVFFLRSFVTITSLHKSRKYHVIHFHNIPDFGIFCTLFAKLSGAKIILDIHDLVPEFYMRKFQVSENHLSIRFLKILERLSCCYADHVITVTEIWRQRLIGRSVTSRKCSVIMNLPMESIFSKQAFTEYRKNDPFCISYHGNLAEHTGVDLLIRAVARIHTQIPQLTLQIIGGGRDESEYMHLAESLGIISAVNFKKALPVMELADAVKHAHVAVDPKRDGIYAGETLSVKAMEYLALGIPLIVARTKAAVTYFPENAVQFFRPDDSDSLAEAILDLYRNPDRRHQLHLQADAFNQRYSWQKAKQTYWSLLSDLCGCT